MDGCPDDNWLGGRGGHIGQNTQIYKGVNQVNRVVIAWYLLKYSVPEVVEGVLPIDYESAKVVSGKVSHGLINSQGVASGISFLTHFPRWMC